MVQLFYTIVAATTTLSYPPIWDQPYHNSPAALIPQEFTTASCFTAYCWAARVELDLEITAGSYNAKANLLK